MKLQEFYRKFENTSKEERFQMEEIPATPTSLFVIFQKLTNVRGLQRHYKDMETHLLNQAEEIFNKRNNGSNT